MIEKQGEDMSRRRRRRTRRREPDFRQLFMIILGFVFTAFGLLLLITPINYPIGNLPITFNPLIGIALIAIGLVLLLRSD